MPKNSTILIRNFDYQESFKDWVLDGLQQDIVCLKEVYEEYLLKDYSDYITYEKGNGYEAILWKDLDLLQINASFMLDYLRQKVIPLGYYLYMSDKNEQVLDGGERVLYERHYLKPIGSIKLDGANKSHYGNITLENAIQSSESKFMKIVSGRYPDQVHEGFHQLIAQLLN